MKRLNLPLKKNRRVERGQAMLLIALAFVGLVAFIGLAIDAGILFTAVGALRRAVDAASLSAANQIRQGYSQTKLEENIKSAAEELVLLNLGGTPADLQVVVETCDTPDTTILNCTTSGYEHKLVRVQATYRVKFAFMPIVGWNHYDITADAISEAASIDLVLVIDNSTSMTYDAPEGDPLRDPDNCNPTNSCEPFESVREAAKVLVEKMFYRYDRIALVTFNRFAGVTTGNLGKADERPTHVANLHLTNAKADATAALDAMTVYPYVASSSCPDWGELGDPRGCMVTNHAAGLLLAAKELQDYGRADALKVVVLLSDGMANAAYYTETNFAVPDPIIWYCPGGEGWPDASNYWGDPAKAWTRVKDEFKRPLCSDGHPDLGYVNGYTSGDWYKNRNDSVIVGHEADGFFRWDPEDEARWFADYLACLPPGENSACAGSGMGAVIFTIGLGNEVTNATDAPFKNAGEELLRYMARVGYNGDPRSVAGAPCIDSSGKELAAGVSCGNYYYSPSGDQLDGVFAEIAERIFTRLTH